MHLTSLVLSKKESCYLSEPNRHREEEAERHDLLDIIDDHLLNIEESKLHGD